MNRRELITGLISLVAAPAIVRVSSIMPVRVMEPLYYSTAYRVLATISNGGPSSICQIGPVDFSAFSHCLTVRAFNGEIKIGDRIFVDDKGRAHA